MKKLAILFISIVMIIVSGQTIYKYYIKSTITTKPIVQNTTSPEEINNNADTNDDEVMSRRINKPQNRKINISITAVGDILVHQTMLDSQYNPNTKQYDFNDNFIYVTPYIKKADLALVNLETTLAGNKNFSYSGYPTFNSPDALAEALKNAGFDVVSAVNNHTIDKGSSGVKRTISVVKEMGFTLLGLRSNEIDKRYEIKDIKGIKIGMISYSYETPPSNGRRTLNAIPIPKEVEGLVNTFNPEKLDQTKEQMKEQIKLMRAEGAELMVFFMHWGDEYARNANSYQKKMAQTLADEGVDIILGCHPHVIEPITYLNSIVSGKQTLVVYSMGNFISNQRFELTGNKYTEDGIMVNINVEKDIVSNKISIIDTSYVPTWVKRTPKDKHYQYEIIPLPAALVNSKAFKINDKETEKRAQTSMVNTTDIMQLGDSRVTIAQPLIEDTTQVIADN